MNESIVKHGFSWSATRHGSFRDCERAYFFQYYLASARALNPDPERAQRASFLKNLTAIPLWIGSEVHDAVEALLRTASQGRDPDPERAVEEMRARMRRAYKESLDNVAGKTGDSRHNARFFEHEYAVDVAGEVWKQRVEEADEMVRSFSRMPYLIAARALSAPDLLGLERLEKWSIDGVPVWVKIDFAYRDADRLVHILDWKTGKFERGENPLQMVGYALYAQAAWGASLDTLRVREVYLRQQDPERHCRLDSQVLDQGSVTIRASIAAMLERVADPQKNLAQEPDFALTDDERTCRNCNFRAICPRWSEA